MNTDIFSESKTRLRYAFNKMWLLLLLIGFVSGRIRFVQKTQHENQDSLFPYV
jgi:hypothetical protein